MVETNCKRKGWTRHLWQEEVKDEAFSGSDSPALAVQAGQEEAKEEEPKAKEDAAWPLTSNPR